MTDFLKEAEPLGSRILTDIKTLVKALPKINVGKVLKRDLVKQLVQAVAKPEPVMSSRIGAWVARLAKF